MVELADAQTRLASATGEFVPGALTTLSQPIAGGALQVEKIDLTNAVAAAVGLELFEHFDWADLLRPPPVRGEIRLADGELVATLDDVRATVTRLTNPTPTAGRPYNYVMLGFSYYITSHGFALSMPDPGDGQGVVYPTNQGINEQRVLFHGPQGIPIYAWPLSFKLECGWNKRYQYFGATQEEVVPWVTLWNGQWTHEVNGWFARC